VGVGLGVGEGEPIGPEGAPEPPLLPPPPQAESSMAQLTTVPLNQRFIDLSPRFNRLAEVGGFVRW
jgi:hypothetical protein